MTEPRSSAPIGMQGSKSRLLLPTTVAAASCLGGAELLDIQIIWDWHLWAAHVSRGCWAHHGCEARVGHPYVLTYIAPCVVHRTLSSLFLLCKHTSHAGKMGWVWQKKRQGCQHLRWLAPPLPHPSGQRRVPCRRIHVPAFSTGSQAPTSFMLTLRNTQTHS